MEFDLSTIKSDYDEIEARRLEEYGFKFRENIMNPALYRMTEPYVVKINFDSLEELMAFVKKEGAVILDYYSIKIYDGNNE